MSNISLRLKKSNISLRLLIKNFNIFGISSVIEDGGDLRISNFLALFHFFKMLLTLVFTICVLSLRELRSSIVADSCAELEFLTIFARNLVHLTTLVLQISLLVVGQLQFLKRQKVLNFLKQMREMEVERNLAKKLETQWKKHFAIMILGSCIMLTSQAFTRFKFSIAALTALVVASYPYVLMSSLLSFVKCFEIFLIVLLIDFRKDLEKSLEVAALDFETHQRLMIKYQKIYNLNRDFLQAFGMQLTLTTCCVTTLMLLTVTSTLIEIL